MAIHPFSLVEAITLRPRQGDSDDDCSVMCEDSAQAHATGLALHTKASCTIRTQMLAALEICLPRDVLERKLGLKPKVGLH